MTRKRAQIVEAALKAFLNHGYAESSVNKIADAAGVSIKTLYRHFETKDELFSAVMQLACSRRLPGAEGSESGPDNAADPAWYAERPQVALVLAGEDYLRHALSEEQLAIYRVVTRDGHRFPELRQRYRKEIVGHQAVLFATYIGRWQPSMGWTVADKYGAAAAFGGLLKAAFFDDAVQGGRKPTEEEISQCARRAAACVLNLLEAGLL
ncbi:TetR/AcrR family transcriptional regulator [Lysobacter sp. CA199]|uniref:TetR/AcrR family transcriptional regulator n=1 Tax=Lysobacter sp. CA199 TaxID=3455608 RepID=UPI003F8D0317